MNWVVIFEDTFAAEFATFPGDVQTALLAKARLLEAFGPRLARPHVDTLKGSKHFNMKELRFDAADGAGRAAFAFDTLRQAVALVAGDKSGESQARFYRALIAKADERFDAHLAQQTARTLNDGANTKRNDRRASRGSTTRGRGAGGAANRGRNHAARPA